MSLDDLFGKGKKQGLLWGSPKPVLGRQLKMIGSITEPESPRRIELGIKTHPLIRTSQDYLKEAIDIGKQRRKEITEKYEHNERIKQFNLEQYLRESDFGPADCNENIKARIKGLLGKFRKATKDKTLAQFVRFNTGNNEKIEGTCIAAIKQYFEIAALCLEYKEKDRDNERLRRILLMDAYESIGDVLMLPWHLNQAQYQNAISIYTELKKEVRGFLDWANKDDTDKEDKDEAKRLLFNTNLSLASLHLLNQDLKNSCNETIAALRLMKSLKNLGGIDYSEFIPFEFRAPSYATKRFSKSKRDNHETPYLPIVGEMPLPRHSLIPKTRKRFLESIMRRRLESDTAIISGFSFNESVKDVSSSSKIHFEDSYKLRHIFRYISLDPTNTDAYVSLFFLEKNPNPRLQELFRIAKKVYDKILLEKAETGNFDMVPVHPNYLSVLTDGEVVFKEEVSTEEAKRHTNLIKFLRNKCSLKFATCEIYTTDSGKRYVKMQLVRNRRNGKPEQEFRAGSLEDMVYLYQIELGEINEPTPKELTQFRQKKLMQAIDAMLEFSSAGRDRTAFEKYGLDIPDLDYVATLTEKVLPRIKLDTDLKQKATRVASELNKAKRAFCHGDPHTGNILDIGEDGLVIIDPVSACYASRFFDLAYLLEQAELDLSHEDKEELIDYFMMQSKGNRRQTNSEPEKRYLMEAAYVNLLFAKKCNNSSRNYYNPEKRNNHIKRAKEILDVLDIG
ncbi:MAG: aminoglycoside phosphotransferase family protein [Nanoarchaeota archaeon]|nr:aminoglycoside phosphotransferase family protein [Nanoarchaeota archaeon]